METLKTLVSFEINQEYWTLTKMQDGWYSIFKDGKALRSISTYHTALSVFYKMSVESKALLSFH